MVTSVRPTATTGAAMGTVIAMCGVGVYSLIALKRGIWVVSFPKDSRLRPDWAIIRSLFRFGLPTGVQGVAMNIGGEDFALDCAMQPDEDVLLHPKQRMIIAARAAGVMPIGFIGTVAGFGDWEKFRAMVRRSPGASVTRPPAASSASAPERILAARKKSPAEKLSVERPWFTKCSFTGSPARSLISSGSKAKERSATS